MGAMKEYHSGDGEDDRGLFLDATKTMARSAGLHEAYRRKSGLFLRRIRTTEALESMAVAASASAGGAPTHGQYGITPVGYAFSHARKHDHRSWWAQEFRNEAPDVLSVDDEFYPPDEVASLVEEFFEEAGVIHASWSELVKQ